MLKHQKIKRMSRKELLELLVLQSKKIDELENDLAKTLKSLNDKQILIKESGSIAEASLKLNNIFEVAQQAADQYLENIKNNQEKQFIKDNTYEEKY